MGGEANNGKLIPSLPDMGQYVTFKWLMGACVGLCIGGAAVTASAAIYLNERFEKKANSAALKEIKELYNDDIKWIKQCMIEKCWDNPTRTP